MERNFKIILFAIFFLFFLFFIPFWKPITLSLIISLFLLPIICRFNKKEIVKSKIALFVVISSTLIITLPFSLGFYGATSRVLELAKKSKEVKENPMEQSENVRRKILAKIKTFSKTHDIKISESLIKNFNKVYSDLEGRILNISKNTLLSLPDFSIQFLIFTLSFYIFLRYGFDIKNIILDFKLLNEDTLNELIKVFQEASYYTIVSLVIIGAIQSTIVVVGALIAGFSELLIIFCLTFIFSFIPVIGAAPVAIFLASIKLFDSDLKMFMVLIICSIIAGTIDNIIKPIFLKRKSNMDSSIYLIAIIGAIIILGIPGLFIGPIIGYVVAHYFSKNIKEKGE